MGQQQLLLVILVTILVGIATLVAFNVFGTAAEEANRDAVRQDILAAAAQAQAIWTRPLMMDGAGQDFAGSGMSTTDLLRRLNIPGLFDEGAGTVTNDNGVYQVTTLGVDTFSITATPESGTEAIVADVSRDLDGQWTIAWNPEAAGG